MSHIINLNNKEILISISKELFEDNHEYINETIDYFMMEHENEGKFGFEDIKDENEVKTLIDIRWEVLMSAEEMLEQIDKMIDVVYSKTNCSDYKEASKMSRIIDRANSFKESINEYLVK